MGVSLEINLKRTAHRRASAVGADQIGSGEPARSLRGLDRHLDTVVALLDGADPRREFDGEVRQSSEARKRDVGELMLLALHDMRIACVSPQEAEIELGDNFAAGAIPDAEFGFDQSAPSDVAS